MNIFGLTVTRTKKELSPAGPGRGWWPVIRESFAGAWQRNIAIRQEDVNAHHAVFSCQTLIASDISKLRIKIVEQVGDIWTERKNSPFRAVLRKPNGYQNRIQFVESWVLSKLQRGNAYVLKGKDNRGMVNGLHVLNPDLVTPLVSDSGEVYYELQADNLAGIGERVVVPAREIIHDRFNCLYHPLVGLSPIYANGLAAVQGRAIQTSSTHLFQNGARPGGILTAPGKISDEVAKRLKDYWDSNFTGENSGKTAVLGDGLKYEAMAVKATDAQLIEQLKWTAEVVCSTYHVPAYKIGAGQMPTVNNVQSLNVEYYSQCLQALIEAIELCLDEGLGFGDGVGTEFDLKGLLRMDTLAQIEAVTKLKGIATLDEQRRELDFAPVEGGGTIYLQQQDHSLAAIAARDEQLIEGGTSDPPPPANDDEPTEEQRAVVRAGQKALLYEKIRGRLNA